MIGQVRLIYHVNNSFFRNIILVLNILFSPPIC